MTESPSERSLYAIFWLTLAAALWSWSLSWNEGMADSHLFRQTQTAITAHWIKEDGYRFAYETPLFGPPWSIPLEFPLYQWCMARFSGATGLGLEQSGRVISILFMLATLPAVYLLAGLAPLSRAGRLLSVASVLSCPIYLFYARTVMIETTALCFATWFVAAVAWAIERLSWRWSVGATVLGGLAAVTKVTTFALYCLPGAVVALALCWRHWSARARTPTAWWRALLLGGVPAVVAGGLGLAWVSFSDRVKATNAFSHFLKSDELTWWNWGDLHQRWSGPIWAEFWRIVSHSVIGGTGLAIMLVCLVPAAVWFRRWALVAVGAFLLGPVIFINVYYRHDYYYAANALLLMMAAGLLLGGMWVAPRIPRGIKLALVVAFFTSQLVTFYRGLGLHHRRQLPPPPAIAAVIHQVVPAEGVVLIYGWDWNSLIPYYSGRRAVLIPAGREEEFQVLDDIVLRLPPLKIAAMVVHRELFPATSTFVRNRALHFGLADEPFATSDDGDLYLPAAQVERARARVAPSAYPDVTFLAAGAKPADGGLKESDLSVISPNVVFPRPVRSSSLYGIGRGTIGTREVLNAHAPADLWIDAPAGAKQITVEFGLNEGAYSGALPYTDGVGFTISQAQLPGAPRVIFERTLDPVHTVADRGTQRFEYSSPTPLVGQLLFQIDPGLKANITKDWAYWARIEVK